MGFCLELVRVGELSSLNWATSQ